MPEETDVGKFLRRAAQCLCTPGRAKVVALVPDSLLLEERDEVAAGDEAARLLWLAAIVHKSLEAEDGLVR